MKKLTLGLILLALVSALIGCAAPARQANMADQGVTQSAAMPAAQPPAQEAKATTGGSAAGVTDDAERMIIRTANLSVVVTDAAQAQQFVVDTVNALGGYVADSSAWREGEQLRARMVVRVPAEKLDALLAAIKGQAVRVQQENITGQDVTEEYSDLNAQLTNLEATEVELRELLTEVRQKTQKAEDVLAVYRELTNIRGQIEQVKGRMQYLGKMTALATANVELIPDVLAKPVVEPGWRPLETLKNAGRALVNTLKGLVDAVIWLVVAVLPVLILIAIPITLIVLGIRWLVRRGRKTQKSAETTK
jgi:hypothetical protein